MDPRIVRYHYHLDIENLTSLDAQCRRMMDEGSYLRRGKKKPPKRNGRLTVTNI
jgi:hypothetical protein